MSPGECRLLPRHPGYVMMVCDDTREKRVERHAATVGCFDDKSIVQSEEDERTEAKFSQVVSLGVKEYGMLVAILARLGQ